MNDERSNWKCLHFLWVDFGFGACEHDQQGV
jgi:hypothetical protein